MATSPLKCGNALLTHSLLRMRGATANVHCTKSERICLGRYACSPMLSDHGLEWLQPKWLARLARAHVSGIDSVSLRSSKATFWASPADKPLAPHPAARASAPAPSRSTTTDRTSRATHPANATYTKSSPSARATAADAPRTSVKCCIAHSDDFIHNQNARIRMHCN